MQKNYKKILFFSLVTTLFLQLALPVFALEVNYPTINAFGGTFRVINGSGRIADFLPYLEYIFIFIVVTSGIFGIISIVTNGLRILLAFGSAESISKAKSDIFGTLLGVLLLMISIVLLRTINTQLVNVSNDARGYTPGVYYIGVLSGEEANPDSWYILEAKESVPETNIWGDDFEWYLWYNCIPSPTSKKLLVSLYDRPDYVINRAINGTVNNVSTKILRCQAGQTQLNNNSNSLDVSTVKLSPEITVPPVRSFRWTYQQPGVYFYLTDNCTGISGDVMRQNGAIKPFDNTVGQNNQIAKCFKIINGDSPNEQYGVVLTAGNDAVSGEVGQCTSILMSHDLPNRLTTDQDLISMDLTGTAPFIPRAAYILKIAPPITGSVTFVSEYYRKRITFTPTSSDPFQSYGGGDDFIAYYYPPGNNVNRSDTFSRYLQQNGDVIRTNWFTQNNDCQSAERSCLTKILFYRNSYYIVLYSKDYNNGNNKYCSVTAKSITDFQNDNTLNFNRNLYKMYIVPSSER